MNRCDALRRNALDEGKRIKMEVKRVGIKIVQVQEKLPVCAADNLGDPRCFVVVAPRRLNQSGYVLDLRRMAYNPTSKSEVCQSSINGCRSARRSGQVSKLNLTAAHKRQMLRP